MNDSAIDQVKEQQDLAEEYLGDFVGDTVPVTQHLVVCAKCGKGGGTLVKIGKFFGAERYVHQGMLGCDESQRKPFNRETRRKLGML